MAKKKESKGGGVAIKEDQKDKARDVVLSAIEKSYGKGAVMRMADADIPISFPKIPTGCLGLDLALGIGGVPQGRITEIYGPESSGKTTLTLHLTAEAQKQGQKVAFIDAEHALDLKYAKNLGVDVSDLDVSQPDSGEQALEITDMLVRSGAYGLVVVDSVAALTPRAEIEGDMGDSHMGLQARLMSQALRKLTGSIAKTNCTVIFINQLRMKIGVMFGNPETTTGGNALKFYSSVRMDIRRIGAIKDGEEIIGNRTRVKVVKNKVAPPFKEVELDIKYGIGIDKVSDLIDQGVNFGVVDKAGAWYSYNNMKIGQGKLNACQYLNESPEILQEINDKILDVYFNAGEIPLEEDEVIEDEVS
jgi:recombination protein RecA